MPVNHNNPFCDCASVKQYTGYARSPEAVKYFEWLTKYRKWNKYLLNVFKKYTQLPTKKWILIKKYNSHKKYHSSFLTVSGLLQNQIYFVGTTFNILTLKNSQKIPTYKNFKNIKNEFWKPQELKVHGIVSLWNISFLLPFSNGKPRGLYRS